MARFDVYKFSKETPYIVYIQAEIHSELATCIVVPLVPIVQANKEFLPKLNPLIVFEGVDYVFITSLLSSVPRHSLKDKVGNLEIEHRQTILDALDFLFHGFWGAKVTIMKKGEKSGVSDKTLPEIMAEVKARIKEQNKS